MHNCILNPLLHLVNQDYRIDPVVPLEVTFLPGDLPNATACGIVTIRDDEAIDGEHYFLMMLADDDDISYVDVPPLITNITILDNDSE